MSDINKIVGENIRVFIESRELKNSWIIERAGIDKTAFYDMLNGKGNIDKHITKLSNFFGIDDPMYFYKTDVNYAKPKNLLDRKGDFFKSIGFDHKNINNQEFKEGLEVFLEFVELIDILKATTE